LACRNFGLPLAMSIHKTSSLEMPLLLSAFLQGDVQASLWDSPFVVDKHDTCSAASMFFSGVGRQPISAPPHRLSS